MGKIKERASGLAINKRGNEWQLVWVLEGTVQPTIAYRASRAFDVYNYALQLQVPLLGRWSRILAGNTVDVEANSLAYRLQVYKQTQRNVA